jgi:flagellar M-ring protein FliF
MADPQKIQSQRFLRLGLASFAVVSAILVLLYFLVLAKDYAVLFENLRESDTSAVTAELGKQGIAYRLRDDGHTLLVDKEEIAAARVAVAAANVLGGGDVGFELFNDSDIGLSEFSQKMNYLRALQGELTRTIMAMENIRFARVHLALPERSIFRNEQARPSAAITVQTADGLPLAPNRVLGLQQLVAAAVTDLAAEQVVILDDAGMPLSTPPAAPTAHGAITERGAFEQYARIKATNAVRDLMGDRRFEVLASARPAASSGPATRSDDTAGAGATTGEETQRLQILVRTEIALSDGEQAAMLERITDQLQLNLGGGDAIGFQTGTIRADDTMVGAVPQSAATWETPEPTVQTSRAPAASSPWDIFANRWLWLLLGVIAVVLWLVWRQRGALSDPERQHFADVLAEEIEIYRAERRG